MMIRSCAATDVGRRRENNEDSHLNNDNRRLYAVADGIGGHAAGEVASKIAIASLAAFFDGDVDFSRAFKVGHHAILDAMSNNREYARMGTTLTALAFRNDQAIIGHVGDSAAFLVRDGVAFKLTTDHVTSRNELTDCLGVSDDAFSTQDRMSIDIKIGDIFILATDGLTDYFEKNVDDTWGREDKPMRRSKILYDLIDGCKFEDIANTLVQYALHMGGRDNITVVAVKVAGVN